MASPASRWRHAASLLVACMLAVLAGCNRPGTVDVPNLVGMARTEAESAITGAGLTVGTVVEQYSATAPAGEVLSQNPSAGTNVERGSVVSLVVAARKQITPNVVGLDRVSAEIAIRGEALTVGVVTQQYDPVIPARTVLSQNPVAGTSVAAGAPVDMVVSNGPQPVKVPKVVGMTQEDAEAAITGATLTVGAVTRQHSPTVALGKVMSQNPAAAVNVLPGTAVNFVVSAGPAPVAVPNVVGMTQQAAQAAIVNAKLIVGAVTQQYSATVPVGTVLNQDPLADTISPVGSAVNLIVSGGVQPVAVPNVVGMTEAAAQTAIVGAHLIVGTVTEQYSTTVAAGRVISQNPLAGANVAPGSAVNLVMSKGIQPVQVPNVVGMTAAAAQTAIIGASLTVGTVTEQYSATVPLGKVISQNPPAGANALPGTAVGMVVSKGFQPVPVPNIVGLTSDEAQTAIISGSLIVGTVTEQYSPTIPTGRVISQNPAAGTTVLPGSAVHYIVSKGPQPVPNVVGMTQAAASAAITGVGFVVGTVTQEFSLTVPAGTVTHQTPAAGTTTVALGSPVNLVVSKGPISVPNVVLLPQAAASTAITGAGLIVGTVVQEYSLTVPVGAVVRQNPAAGTNAGPASPVNLVISKGAQHVPAVVGMAQSTAASTITGAGLNVGTVTQEYSLTVPGGTVISQNPISGTAVELGSAVSMVVSKGQLILPNVVGMTQTDATTAITGAALVVGTVTQQYSLTIAAGLVMEQSPLAGTAIAPGTAVHLVVSRGPLFVPNVVGTTQVAATSSLVNVGLTVGEITRQYSETIPAGSVTVQNPAAWVAVEVGSAVHLEISRGPQPGVPDLTELRVFTQIMATFSGHAGDVTSVAYSPTGNEVVTGSMDKTAKLWEAATGALIYTVTGEHGHAEAVTAVAFSPDGTLVLTGSADWTAKLWEVETGRVRQTFIGHTRNVTSVAFSPDGSRVLTGSNDTSAKLWEVATGKVLQTYPGHPGAVLSVAYGPDGKSVYTCCPNGNVFSWNVQTGTMIRSFGPSTSASPPLPYAVACSPNGTRLVVAGAESPATVYLVGTGGMLGQPDLLGPAVYSPDGSMILGPGLTIDATSGVWLQNYGSVISARAVTTSPDGTRVVFGGVSGATTRAVAWNTLAAAQAALVDAGLVPGHLYERSGTTVTIGCVAHQDPLPGTIVPLGTPVDLWYSTGP